MNKKYRLLAIPLVLMMVVSGLVLINNGTDESQGDSDANWEYTVNSYLPDRVTLTKYIGPTTSNLVIPSTISNGGTTYYVMTVGGGTTSSPSSVITNDKLNPGATLTFPTSLPDGYTMSIGPGAFGSCTNFAGSLIFPDYISSIGRSAFSGCRGFTGELDLRNISAGGYAFSGCTGFTSLVMSSFPSEYAFTNCTGLTSITFDTNQPIMIGEGSFFGCTGLTGCLDLSNVSFIGQSAFSGCNNISSVILGRNLAPTGYITDPIRQSAFYNCTNLKTVYNLSPLTITSGDTGNGYVGYYADNVYTCYIVTLQSNNTSYGTLSKSSIVAVSGSTLTATSTGISSTVPDQTSTPIYAPSTVEWTYYLENWTNATGSINADRTVTANFNRTPTTYTVTFVSNNISWGTVSNPSVTVPYGTSISVSGNTLTIGNNTITATPHAQDSSYSYYFDYWYNASGTVTGDREIKAYFGRELTDAIQLFVGQTWTYTPTTSIPSATFSISGTATSWLSLTGGTITGTAPNVDEITYYHLVITAQTTNPTQTETQSMDFAVIPYMTASVSPNILYLWAGGPIPSSLAETITFSYTGFGTGSYTWTILDAHNTGVQITSDGTIYGTAGAITNSPVSITARLTGNVNGIIQTQDVTFSVVIVAKLIFTSDPLTDAVIS